MNLIFVYNAESGKINTMLDIAHKLISPSTYKCNLCSLTPGSLNEKNEWTKFKKSTKHKLEFYHIDEFQKKFKMKYEYPVILESSDNMKVLFSATHINQFKSIQDLISAIEKLEPR